MLCLRPRELGIAVGYARLAIMLVVEPSVKDIARFGYWVFRTMEESNVLAIKTAFLIKSKISEIQSSQRTPPYSA